MKFCPDVNILQKNTVAWIEANNEPFNQRRRCEMNSGTCYEKIPSVTHSIEFRFRTDSSGNISGCLRALHILQPEKSFGRSGAQL